MKPKYIIPFILYILVAVFWILFYFYIRFIIIRLPYDLDQLKNNILPSQLNLFYMFIIIQMLTIIVVIYHLLRGNKKEARYIILLKTIYNNIYIKPLENIQNVLSPYIPYSGTLFFRFCKFLDSHSLEVTKVYVLLFYALPRLIIAIVFFIDLVIYKRIYYWIVSLFLLIIPLLWKIFVSLFIIFGKRNKLIIEEWLVIKPIGQKFVNGFYETYSFSMNPKYDESYLKEYADAWRDTIKIIGYGTVYFQGFQNEIQPYVTIVCSNIYVIGGIYRL